MKNVALATLMFVFSTGYHATADASVLTMLLGCFDTIAIGTGLKAPPPVTAYSYKNQVNESARRMMIAGPENFSDYHANAVDFIVTRHPLAPAKEAHAYSVLIMIRANDTIASGVAKAIKNRFDHMIQEGIYTDKDGKQHPVLAITGSIDNRYGFELPAAELLIVMARNELMAEVQRLQRKNQAGIIYLLTYFSGIKRAGDSPWFESEKDGFQVGLRGGNNAGNW